MLLLVSNNSEPTPPEPVSREQQLENMVRVFVKVVSALRVAQQHKAHHRILVAENMLDGAVAAADRLLDANPPDIA